MQVDAAASWYAKPSKSTKLKASQGQADCQAACAKSANSKKACAAFSLSVKAGAKSDITYCDLYFDWVPQRVCGANDFDFNCQRASQGSWRAKWVYS